MTSHEQFADQLLSYAMGELRGSEMRAFEDHLHSCSQCQRQLREVQTELGLLALSVQGPAAPARSKERLLRTIAREPKARTVFLRRPWWMLAPVVAAAILALFGILLWRQNQQFHRRNEILEARLRSEEEQAGHARELLAMLTSSETLHFTLVATTAQPQPQIRTIAWPRKGQVLLLASRLKAAPADKVYELWILPASGSPIPAGTFKPDGRGNATMMETLPGAKDVMPKSFAVTMEPEGGSNTPTMPILMAGD